MGLLDELLGGGDQQGYQDFVDRYEQGPPYEGISDDETADRYHRVSSQLSPDEYQRSAEEAFSRLSPEERG